MALKMPAAKDTSGSSSRSSVAGFKIRVTLPTIAIALIRIPLMTIHANVLISNKPAVMKYWCYLYY